MPYCSTGPCLTSAREMGVPWMASTGCKTVPRPMLQTSTSNTWRGNLVAGCWQGARSLMEEETGRLGVLIWTPSTMVFKENLFIQGGFFNWPSPENVSRLAPPKMPRLAPPYFKKFLSMAAERGEIPNTLTFSIPRGGQYWTLTFFWNQLLTGQHLANSGEGQLKNHPVWCKCIINKIMSELLLIHSLRNLGHS